MLILPLIVVALSSLSPGHVRATRLDELAHAAAAVCHVPLDVGFLHADAALSAELEGVPAEVTLGLGCVESRLTAAVRSRGGRYCGALQATRDFDEWSCAELETAWIGYRAGARHLALWLRGRHLRRALAGYGGVSVNGATSYPDRVIQKITAIRARVSGHRLGRIAT